jgi:hypothetical protein
VDFDTPQLLGQTIHIAKPKTRLLVSTWKKAMHQYRVELDDRLQAQNIYSCATKLLAKYQTTAATTPWMDELSEIINKYITNCMLKAEETIHKYNLEDFSPYKVEMALSKFFWKLALQAIRRNSIPPTQPMQKIINRYPNMDIIGMDDKDTIIQRLYDSKEKYKDAIARGKEIRHDFLVKRAQIAHKNSTLTIETAIKQLVHIKASIQTYASIKRVMNRTPYQAGLTSICVPTEDGAYQTIVDAPKIEAQLINRNRNHYAQAEHTVMAHHLIRKEMGTSGTSNFCNRVLSGMANLTHLPATLQAIFSQLHQPHPVKVDNLITFSNYKDPLHKWKESTLTSPSSRHLGHYISLLKHISNETDEIGETILQLHHTMLQIAQHCCRPYNWWKTEMEVMLEKDKGDPKIDRLHIICLYEADYNIFLK